MILDFVFYCHFQQNLFCKHLQIVVVIYVLKIFVTAVSKSFPCFDVESFPFLLCVFKFHSVSSFPDCP